MSFVRIVEILLAEDNDEDAELTIRMLRRGGILNAVTRARDGVEALDWLRQSRRATDQPGASPALILLDLNLPRLGGIEVARQLKADPATNRIPIIVLTESTQSRDIIEGYNLGVNGYLIKPISPAAFNEVVTQIGLFWSITAREDSELPQA